MTCYQPHDKTTCRCGRPTRDAAYVCDECLEQLEIALGDSAWLDAELEVTLTRQKAASVASGSRSATTPLPWHERASEAKRNLHDLLVLWVRLCDEEGVRGRPEWYPRDTTVSLARWLLHCRAGLALHEAGGDAMEEITDAVAEARRVVFWKRRNRNYLGPCGQSIEDDDGEVILESCDGGVYADQGAEVGDCDQCGQGVTVAIRRAEIEKQLDDRLCTAAEIARFAVHLGLDAPRDRVRKRVHYWHRHGRIIKRGEAEDGSPRFQYGEVRSMLYSEFARAEPA